jgi:hypothetical protein
MISARLQEMDLDEEEIDEIDFMRPYDTSDEQQETGFGNIEQGMAGKGDVNGHKVNEEDLEEDFDLSAILAELDEEEVSEPFTDERPFKNIKGTEKGYPKTMNEAEEEIEAEEEESDEDEESEEETEIEGDKITDLTVDQLKDIIKDIISAELEAEEYETPEDEAGEEGGEEMSMDMGDMGGEEEEVNLEELLAELDALEDAEEAEAEAETMQYEAKKKLVKKEKEEKEEMKEAIATINALRNELNETNLLNAKLLYVNKIFKAKNLTESQKLKVITSFDRATTPKQAKELFESIQNSDFGASKKSQIKESLGFASKAAGVASRNSANTIVESNDVIARMQKLANIIK